jgi:hypothetical protein
MGGALIQLVAYGAQDVYLTGDPKKTFWRNKFSRYSNFATESIEQTVSGGDIVSNQNVSITLKRNGDLVSSIHLEITFQRGPSSPIDPLPYYSCEQLIDSVEVFIGGQKVMNFGHEWFRMYWELYLNPTQASAYARMADWGNEQEGYIRTFHLPLPLWFNALENGNALPLIALQYHEVEIKLKLCDIIDIPGINPAYKPKIRCYANYTFLDTPERTWFAQNSHEYIIQQIQTNYFNIQVDRSVRDHNLPLNFNHPCSSLIWCFTPGYKYHGQYTSEPGEQDADVLSVLESGTLLLNGMERFSARRGSYFSNESTWCGFSGTHTSSGIGAYAFGVHSNKSKPSGTCNFSRLDSVNLRIRTKAAVVDDPTAPGVVTDAMTTTGSSILNTLIVFAPNYNVLRIQSGMGGMAYAS